MDLFCSGLRTFINNRRKINQVMQKFHKLTSLSKILMIYITQFYLLKA